jgi:hypothetical protein
VRTIVLVLAALTIAAPASAQQARIGVAADGLYQALFDPFSKTSAFELFSEEGTFTAVYPPGKSPAVAGAVVVRVWQSIGVGASVTRMRSTTAASVSGDIPHPFFFGRNRSFTGDTERIARDELGVHLQFRLVVPVTARFDLSVFAGPSAWRIRQDRIQAIDYDSQYPFDEVEFAGVSVGETRDTAWGYNAGVDVAMYFSRHVGAGAVVLLATANPDATATASNADTRIGGLRLGGGLRLRF